MRSNRRLTGRMREVLGYLDGTTTPQSLGLEPWQVPAKEATLSALVIRGLAQRTGERDERFRITKNGQKHFTGTAGEGT